MAKVFDPRFFAANRKPAEMYPSDARSSCLAFLPRPRAPATELDALAASSMIGVLDHHDTGTVLRMARVNVEEITECLHRELRALRIDNGVAVVQKPKVPRELTKRASLVDASEHICHWHTRQPHLARDPILRDRKV